MRSESLRQRPTLTKSGSLNRRMITIATVWISVLLLSGGFVLDRVMNEMITRNFDSSLEYVLVAMIRSSEIGPDGEVRLVQPLGDQSFLEPYSGRYWQIHGEGHEPFRSRSLWERTLPIAAEEQATTEAHSVEHSVEHIQAADSADSLDSPAQTASEQAVLGLDSLSILDQEAQRKIRGIRVYNSDVFPEARLRILERRVTLPESDVVWHFQVAQNRTELDAQIALVRRTLFFSLATLGIGLIIMAYVQTLYGLWPLRDVRQALTALRRGEITRVTAPLPREVQPVVDELNALLAHNDRQAEEARTHAGNLAHALKTPLTVLLNAATSKAETPAPLQATIKREAAAMRKHIDHHLVRARAIGRRGAAQSRVRLADSVESVVRAVSRLYPTVRIDSSGDKNIVACVERQDLDEMLGNLIENAAKYGRGSVFISYGAAASHAPASRAPDDTTAMAEILIEDDGRGIAVADRQVIFNRGVRLDSSKAGTGLGLAIVRDVAEIYGGRVALEDSEDMGGLQVRLQLPCVAS